MKIGKNELRVIAVPGPAPAVRLVVLAYGVQMAQQEAPAAQARELAAQLLAAADRAEGKGGQQ